MAKIPIENLGDYFESRIDAAVRGIKKDVATELVNRTPIDSGRMLGAWKESADGRTAKKNRKVKNPEAVKDRMRKYIDERPAEETLRLANSAFYARAVDQRENIVDAAISFAANRGGQHG